MHGPDLFTEANNRKSDRRAKAHNSKFCWLPTKLLIAFTDRHYGRSLNYMEYPRRSLPLFRSSIRRATVRSKSTGTVGDMSSWFQVITGVWQGCILSPLLFAIMTDWVLRSSTERSAGGIMWTGDLHLCDFNFADDIALIDDSWSKMQLTTSVLQEEASKVWLFINPDKCKVMTTSAWNDRSDIQVEERGLELVSGLVSWSLTSLFSTNQIWLYQRRKVRDGKLSVPSEGKLAIY